MNTKFPHIQTLENVSNYIEPGQLNDLLNMYINNDTMYSILILNGILCYLYPPK